MPRLPDCRCNSNPDDTDSWLAMWTDQRSRASCGLITLLVIHPVIMQQVINVYEEAIISRVAHSEQFRGQIPEEDLALMRSPQALSISLLGLITEDAMISPRVAGRLCERVTGMTWRGLELSASYWPQGRPALRAVNRTGVRRRRGCRRCRLSRCGRSLRESGCARGHRGAVMGTVTGSSAWWDSLTALR
ncbi:hypothetical protein [Saccharopolyspora hattusasensis]|uniref:hypothetical protein n=1 Tax=Saccharopolyspora hattusasensis TaxID=1128679 RepID=UPI003D964ABD